MTLNSVLDKARALSAQADRLRVGAAAEENAKRILTRLEELNAVFDEVEAALGAADRLRERGVDLPVVRLDLGREALARSAGDAGLPPMRAFTSAKEKIEGVRRDVRLSLSQAWSQWTTARTAELALHRMVMLPPVERRTEEARLSKLNKLRRVDVPSRSDVVEFAAVHAGLKEDLDALKDPAPELQTLLNRLGQRTTLAHLSDDDIALLRRYEVADQIEVQRRSG
ncbi:hypothetical protein [Micromonospora chokoriensis]|uniref:Uncharacterized protein n=1 Tax=Micromonospora chokoriensis TaxID=356851 RepID=A0A1C4UQD7_9ACTN|nr:hypothetical protein [Micromonospora chokoriensis]SCE73875.1 hypothetical protein GA0070612_0645 [Micromonospora chokoriensis]